MTSADVCDDAPTDTEGQGDVGQSSTARELLAYGYDVGLN
ncbi:hypothetical protein M2155_000570 [Streptomyces sp. SAI-119]|nr:hypothetical protein [Streptomyces sp. SAI-119]